MKRREFIELSAKSIGGLLIYSLAGEPLVVNAQIQCNRAGRIFCA